MALATQITLPSAGGSLGRIRDWSADSHVDSHVRAFVASDQVLADKAVRAPVFAFLESALAVPKRLARLAPFVRIDHLRVGDHAAEPRSEIWPRVPVLRGEPFVSAGDGEWRRYV
jgi:hypothetical protein